MLCFGRWSYLYLYCSSDCFLQRQPDINCLRWTNYLDCHYFRRQPAIYLLLDRTRGFGRQRCFISGFKDKLNY